MSDKDMERFRQTLDSCESWPCDYLFKFIAPRDKAEKVMELLQGAEVSVRESSKGSYVSLTARMPMRDSAEVVKVYEAAAAIDGVMCL